MVLVEYKTAMKELRYGTCSKYLTECSPFVSRVNIKVTRGSLKMNKEFTKNFSDVLMVGPGTGVSPFLSFLSQQNFYFDHQKGENVEIPNLILFFGCRFKKCDDYVGQKYSNFESVSQKLTIVKAFSREDESKKVYVQGKMQENKAKLFEMFSRDKFLVYIAG